MNEIRLGSRTLQPGRQLLANGRRVPLGKRALDILTVLAEADGGIVTKDELLAAVWPGTIVEENALQVHIVALRKELDGVVARRREEIDALLARYGVPAPLSSPAREGSMGSSATPGKPLLVAPVRVP